MQIGHAYIFGTLVYMGENPHRETHEGVCVGETNGVIVWDPLPAEIAPKPPRTTRSLELEFTVAVMPWTPMTTDTQYREALAKASQ